MGTTADTLPDDLLEAVAVVAEVTGNDRDEIVEEAVREHLARFEDDEIRATLVDRYLKEEVGFGALAAFLGREDAEVVRASKSVLDRGEKLADELADGD